MINTAGILFYFQLKDSIIDQISSVKVTSLEQVSQMAAVVALATEQKDEISQNSQVKIIYQFMSMCGWVSRKLVNQALQ